MGELVALAHRDVLRDIVAVPLELRDATEADAVNESVKLGLPLPLGERERLGDALAECETLIVTAALGGVDTVDVVDNDPAREGDLAGDGEGDAVPALTLRVAVGDVEPHGDAATLRVCERDASLVTPALVEWVRLADAEGLGEALEEVQADSEKEGEGVTEELLQGEGLLLGDGVPETDADCVRPGEPLREPELDTDAHRVVLLE